MSNYDMDELRRQGLLKERDAIIEKQRNVRYDDHIVSQPLLEPDSWIYNPENCTEKIEIDIPAQVMLQYSMIAHDRDITLNHLINEVLHDTIQRDLLQHSR